MRDLTTIQWQRRFPGAPGLEGDVEVLIDVQRLDEQWKKDDDYVKPGGLDDDESKMRYKRFGEFVETARFVHMPEVAIDHGIPGFADGRHRFAWLRDHGLKVMPIATDRECKPEFERLFSPGKS